MSTLAPVPVVRAGSAADVDHVEALMADAFDPRFGEAWTRGQCLGVMGMPGVWLSVAELDGAPAGFALARAVADEAELLLIATSTARRRRGVAAALLGEVIGECRSRGLSRLHLEVRAGNSATELYHRAGFLRIGERRRYYQGAAGERFDALTYAMRLAA